MSDTPKLSRVEQVKLVSRHLRGPVEHELHDGSDHFSDEGYQILSSTGFTNKRIVMYVKPAKLVG